MKKAILAGVALIAAAPAHSADLGQPVYKAAVIAPPPVFSWTGCYIGGQVGGAWGSDTVSIPNLAFSAEVPPETLPPGLSAPSVSGDTSGFVGGGQAGCNYQFASNWVIGLEGDGSTADIKGDVSASVPFQGLDITGTARAKTDWLTSATARLGWAWDRLLIYGKGGAAWAGDKYSADIPVFQEHLEASANRTGWTVGAGIEWAFWNNWSARIEYDYYDFFTRTVDLTGTFAGGPIAVPGIDIKQTLSTVTFGINYRFGLGKTPY